MQGFLMLKKNSPLGAIPGDCMFKIIATAWRSMAQRSHSSYTVLLATAMRAPWRSAIYWDAVPVGTLLGRHSSLIGV